MTNTADMQTHIGKVVAGRYEIVSPLGAGGMGMVFKARQVTMNRFVAVKLLHAHYSQNKHASGRFEREMQVTAKIEHPNTIRVYDYGQTEDGQLFLAMELLPGRTLAQVLREDERPMPLERILKVGIQIAKALVAAHAEGVVHRDLKPENVMLLDLYGERDFVKVLDFGIARLVDADSDQQRLTAEGAVVGTPAYMSPEQATGAPPDFRTDLYSFGVMLFEMATGGVPFDAPTTVSLMVKHVQELPPRPSELRPGAIPAALEQLILQCLEKDPKARPSSTEDVVKRLEACLPHRSPGALAAETRKTPATEQVQTRPAQKSRMWLWVSVGLIAAAAAAVVVWLATKGSGGGTVEPTTVASATTAADAGTSAGADAVASAAEEAVAVAETVAAEEAVAVAETVANEEAVAVAETVATEDAVAQGEVAEEVVAQADVAVEPEVVEPPDPRKELALTFMDAGEPDAPSYCQTREPKGTVEILTKAARLLAGGKASELRPVDSEAYELLKTYADLISASAEGQVLLARATLRAVKQTPNEALAPAMKAVALCDVWAVGHLVLGNVYQAKQDNAKAKQSYLRARDRQPDFMAPQFNAVLVEIADKHPKEAITMLDDMLRRYPETKNARLLRGQAYLMAADPNAALVDLEVATQEAPRDANAWMLLGTARNKVGELEGAKLAFCKAKELGHAAAASLCKDKD